MGTDKLSHFISSGWTYYSTYTKALKNGQTPEEADRSAVRRGLLEEKLILGAAASGILSLADIESSYQGMHFYRDFCGGDKPTVTRSGDQWVISRPIDVREYVNPRWDESFQPSIFTKSRWKKVKPQLVQYCDRLDDPEVVARLARYRDRDRLTVAGEVINEMVAAGELQDPNDYSLEANCPAPNSAVDLDAGPVADEPPAPPAVPPKDLTQAIIESEHDTTRRFVGMAAVRLNYPQIASISYGVMLTRTPREAECFRPCDMRGPFAQLEPGLGGGKFSLGWAHVIGEQRHGPAYFSAVYLAFGLKASVLHSWGSHSAVPEGQTYVGPEFEFSVARVNMGIGVMGRISGDEGRDWIVTGLLGWGF
jgi:hypothetical protein